VPKSNSEHDPINQPPAKKPIELAYASRIPEPVTHNIVRGIEVVENRFVRILIFVGYWAIPIGLGFAVFVTTVVKLIGNGR
jgi:hypothetical protein